MSLSFPPPPYSSRATLRSQCLEALRSGDERSFDKICSLGWTPFLHDLGSPREGVGQLARDIFFLSNRTHPPISFRAIDRLFERWPELIWDMSWQSPHAKSSLPPGAELERLWKTTGATLKKKLIPHLPPGFLFSKSGAVSLSQIEALALPGAYDEPWPADSYSFYGFFQSPAWLDATQQLVAKGEQASTVKALLVIKAQLCSRTARALKKNETKTAHSLMECLDELDQVIKPLASSLPKPVESRASAIAAYFCAALDQPAPFLRALSDLDRSEQGDSIVLDSFKGREANEARQLATELSRRLSIMDDHAGAAGSGRTHPAYDAQKLGANLALAAPLPWRLILAHLSASRCLETVNSLWGNPPEAVVIKKNALFRPPSGILTYAAKHIQAAGAKSEETSAALRDFFSNEANKSARQITQASLPPELSSILLGKGSEDIQNPCSGDRPSSENSSLAIYQKMVAKAARRAKAGQPFFFFHTISFSWGALALGAGIPPERLQFALPLGGLSKAAGEAGAVFERLKWPSASQALIEQDELSSTLAADPVHKPTGRANRL